MSLDRMRRDIKSMQHSFAPTEPPQYGTQIRLPDNQRDAKVFAPGETFTEGPITIYGLQEYLYAHKKEVWN